jgi:hypothetical protein
MEFMINQQHIEYGLIAVVILFVIGLISWAVKNLKIKHVWTIHGGLGLATGFLIILFLHVQIPEGTYRELLVGDSDIFSWPFTIQNAMWIIFAITLWMLMAEAKLSALDKDKAELTNLDAHIEGRLEPLRYLIWLIPTLGFLGTIVGMSTALSALAGAEDLKTELQNGLLKVVMMNLGTAFYTTILGLIMNAICNGVMSIFVFQHKQVLAERR